MNSNLAIVKRIKSARKQRGLTQKDLANLLERTPAAISDLERGKVQVTASDLSLLANFLDKPIEFFFGEEFYGEDIQDLISIIRKMPADIRANQIQAIKAILSLNTKTAMLRGIDEEDEDEQLAIVKEIYDTLIHYLRAVNDLREKGIEVKSNLETLLGLDID